MKKKHVKPQVCIINCETGAMISSSEIFAERSIEIKRSFENSDRSKKELQVEKKLLANPDFMSREIAGEFILVPVGKATQSFNGLVSFNETAIFLWNMLEHKKTRKELYECLAKEYELTEEESKNDVDEFLEAAIKEHIILQC